MRCTVRFSSSAGRISAPSKQESTLALGRRLKHDNATMIEEERTLSRQSAVEPVFAALVAWAESESTRIQARSPIGEAIN